MKKVNLLLLITFCTILSISACKNKAENPTPNDDHHYTQPNKAGIIIQSPADNMTYHQGDTIKINVVAVGEQILHGWEIIIREKGDTAKIFTKAAHAHDKTLTISETWVNNIQHDSELELEVIVGLDHDGNKANKKAIFHCVH